MVRLMMFIYKLKVKYYNFIKCICDKAVDYLEQIKVLLYKIKEWKGRQND